MIVPNRLRFQTFFAIVVCACADGAPAQVVIGPQDGGNGGVVIGQPVIPAPAPSPPPRRFDDGRRWDDDGYGYGRDHPVFRGLTDRDAVRIARIEGLRDIDEVVRTRNAYRVEGTDAAGDDIEVVVDRRDGRVISVR